MPKQKRGMLSKVTRASVRQIALSTLGLFVATWLVRWAAQLGAFNDPQGQVNALVGFIVWLTSQGWFQWLSGIILGFTAGAWIDAKLKVVDLPKFLWHRINRKVPNLKDVYLHDFSEGRCGVMGRFSKEDYEARFEDGTVVKFDASIVTWFDGRTLFPIFYISPTSHFMDVCNAIIENLSMFLSLAGGMTIGGGGRGPPQTAADLTFSGRVFLYHAPQLSSAQLAEAEALFRGAGLSVQIRGAEWAMQAAIGDGSIFTAEPQRTVRMTAAERGEAWDVDEKVKK